MSNRSKRDTKTINYKKFNTSGMADTGEQRLKIEKSTEVTQLEATAAEVNKHGVLQLLEDDDIDEDELSSMKEEIETLKKQEEKLRKQQDFHETKKQLEKQKAKIESLKDRQMSQLGVCSTSPDSSTVGRVRRNAFQMCHMINQYTGRSCLSFNPYGCFCGYGQRGSQPVDAADRCCKAHDDCYGEVHTEHHCSFWSGLFVGYNHQCTDTGCVCKDEAKCARKVCDCDLQLAKCLAESEFNPQYQHYERSQCV